MKHISLFFTIVCLAGCFGSPPEKNDLEGKPLPVFNLLLADSSTWFNTSYVPDGKPIALFLFSPQCPYCRAQTKEIIEDMDKLKNIHFYFITSFPFPEMKRFVDEYRLTKYSNITTGFDTAFFTGNYYEATSVPYIAIYGKDKKLKKSFVGMIYSKQIIKAAQE